MKKLMGKLICVCLILILAFSSLGMMPVTNPDNNSEEMYVARATFYDYYSDSQITSGGLGSINDGVYGTLQKPTENSFTKFNNEMSKTYGYADASDPFYTIRYPLYLGLFYGTQSSLDNGGYFQRTNDILNASHNFWLAANSSQLGSSGVANAATQALVDNKLAHNGNITQANGAEILPYFNKSFLTGKLHTGTSIPLGDVREDVSFPFRSIADNSGVMYYEFDSRYDTVRFNDNNKLDYLGYNAIYNSSVQVLDQKGNDGSESLKSGFFPYNVNSDGNSTRLNFGFGTKIEIPFAITDNGKIKGQNIVFKISGNDDIWVFVDGELALDIGGVHGRVSGEIDFANQTSVVSGVKKTSAFSARDKYPLVESEIDKNVTTSFSKALAACLNDTETTHILTVFYMERGKIESNMMINFNFPQLMTIQAGVGGSIVEDKSGCYTAGESISIAANANSGYIFSGWTSTGGGTFGDVTSASTTFEMPTNAVTVTANFTPQNKPPVSVAGVNLSNTVQTLNVGQCVTLAATVLPINATNRTVTWSSGNSDIATVDSTGKVTAKAVGTAAITVKTNDGGFTDTCVVTAKGTSAPTTVKVTGVKTLPSLYIVKGKGVMLSAAVQPYNAKDKTCTWKSANSSIAKVDAKTGKVKGIKVGNTKITVTTNDGNQTATCAVTVVKSANKLKGLSITPYKAKGLLIGQKLQVKPKLNPTKATGIVPKYTSSKPTVAVVDKEGVITALSLGKTIITVTAGKYKKTFTLTVGKVAVTKITLNKKTESVSKGKKVTLFVKSWTPANAGPKTVTWTTSNKKIATVTSKGVVKGIKKGIATITATTWNGKTAKCTVRVN